MGAIHCSHCGDIIPEQDCDRSLSGASYNFVCPSCQQQEEGREETERVLDDLASCGIPGIPGRPGMPQLPWNPYKQNAQQMPAEMVIPLAFVHAITALAGEERAPQPPIQLAQHPRIQHAPHPRTGTQEPTDAQEDADFALALSLQEQEDAGMAPTLSSGLGGVGGGAGKRGADPSWEEKNRSTKGKFLQVRDQGMSKTGGAAGDTSSNPIAVDGTRGKFCTSSDWQEHRFLLSGKVLQVSQVRDQGMIDITDRYALLIGNSDYLGTLQAGVSRCTNDAEDLGRQLACDTLGVYKFKTRVLFNKTKEQIENSIREWLTCLPRRCVALVMFAGHALEFQGKNYLLPVDAPESMSAAEIQYKCISLDYIMACILQQLGSESLIIALLDCCREETFTRGLQTSGGTGKRGLGLVNLSNPDSAAVFVGYAAAPGMVAMERPHRRNGNFTEALLFALKHHEISRQDIRICFGAVVDNVLKNEPRRQRPHSENNMTKGFAFRPS